MATRMDRTVRQQLSTLFNVGVVRDLTDGQLLERYATGQGEAAELAFAALVERHGPMVLRVCRARLADPHDALDAFQATFLVLIEKARGLWVRDSLGPWLHQVAWRTATCALASATRRRRAERTAVEFAASEVTDDGHSIEFEQTLHAEIDRLPERYRVVIVLCDLEGQTCEEAARRIGRPVGTVKCWRSRGRERLRRRLIRSGLAPTSALGAAYATDVARAAEAARALTDGLTTGAFPASVHALVKGVFKAMILSKLKTVAAVICATAFLAAGLGTAVRVAAKDPRVPGDSAPSEAPRPASSQPSPLVSSPPPEKLGDKAWSLSLRDAVRIGLKNADFVDVLPHRAGGGWQTPLKDSEDRFRDANCSVHPVYADANPHRFKADVMALVRSIEQQYWCLSQQHVQLWAAEEAARLADGVFKSEQAELKLGRGTQADVAEARQRLEQLQLDVATKTSDVITTERELRHLLSLPAGGNRCIVPVSVPVEAKLEPNWEESLAVMREKHPEIVQASVRLKAKATERTLHSGILRSGHPRVSPRRCKPGDRSPIV